ncbi:Amidase, putative [Synechococcus sp. PCC 7335]|uniref:amidase n=1 Tax=Synechococcus sp. (strain ATCC 29403 / PCC 7335) TaxID=91464 RepID=UPI00017ECB2E|nr:amidase [Synechococcus sp. PCC 7335]EDX85941.1 Amidase, putative [Synechococcus sp. PCC 7335]
MTVDPNWLTLKILTKQLREGRLTVTQLLQSCIHRINQHDSQVHAWEHLDIQLALQLAKGLDRAIERSDETPPSQIVSSLFGIPIGVKDIFATLDMPTGWGMDIYRDRYLDHEAAVVSRLKAAGAIILGNTVTTELATAAAGPTANPHHLQHTPGGSSSGSAAAVADGMVPLAIGSQTMGSILRPAAYCGIFGFKPSFGLISRYGMMPVCQELDHVGIFARGITDLQILLTVLVGPDRRDPDSWLGEPFGTIESTSKLAQHHHSSCLRIGFVSTPYWNQAEKVTQVRLHQAMSKLQQAGINVEEVSLPREFDRAWEVVQTLCAYGLHKEHGSHLPTNVGSPILQTWLQRGQAVSDANYRQACQYRDRYRQLLQPIFAQYDALLSPVTLGPAPFGLTNTGSPVFCGLWSLCGLPALNLPLGQTESGLPLGAQLIGPLYADRELLKAAEQCWTVFKMHFGGVKRPTG